MHSIDTWEFEGKWKGSEPWWKQKWTHTTDIWIKAGNSENSQCFGNQTWGQNAFSLLLRQKEIHTLTHSQSLGNYTKILNSVKHKNIQEHDVAGVVGESTVRMQWIENTVWCTNLSSIFKHVIWYQFSSATASPRNPPGILNGTFQRVLFLFSDRCLLRMLPHKRKQWKGTQQQSVAAWTQLGAKQNRKTKRWLLLH